MKLKFNWLLSAALSAGVCSPLFGQITGSVKLDGTPPEMKKIDMSSNPQAAAMHKDPVFEEAVVAGDKGELANVVVSIKAADGQALKGDIPKNPVVLTQKGCCYFPHVVACMVGQDVSIKSEDDLLHNVHTLSLDNDPVNFAQNKQPGGPAAEKTTKFAAAETFKVKCDIHPWMAAWIVVLDHPFFAVTGADGKYSIDTKGLADGNYTLDFWQERYGDQTQKITVKDGKATADCTFKSGEKADAGTAGQLRPVSYAAMAPAACCVNTTGAK
jgi:plastocyanin